MFLLKNVLFKNFLGGRCFMPSEVNLLKLLIEIDELLLRVENEESLFPDVLKSIIETGGYSGAELKIKKEEKYQVFERGEKEHYIPFSLPINYKDINLGSLTIYSDNVIPKDSFEDKILRSLAINIGIGIYFFRLRGLLENASREWRATFDSIKDIIFVSDTKGTILRANKPLSNFLEIEIDDILGKNYLELLNFFFEEDYLKKMLEKKEGINFNLKYENHWYNVSIYPVYKNSEIIRANFVISDITEIIESRERYKKLFEEAPVAFMEEDFSEFKKHIYELRRRGVINLRDYFKERKDEFYELIKKIKILEVNKECISLYEGEKKEDFIGKDLSIIFGEKSFENSLNNLEKMIEKIEGFQYENINYTLKGNEKYLLIKFIIFPEYRDTWQRILVSLVDITEKRETEEKLRKNYVIVNKAFYQIIDVITNFCLKKDPYTHIHQIRVSELATAISEEMGLSKDTIERIKIAGLLHDIGKILLPPEILNKPGKLNIVEFELIKTHPKLGYEVLENLEYPYFIAPIVLQHHERLNGSGYPLGLREDEIIFEAKIIQVADVVEAISSYRPYRPSLGIDKALEEIEKGKGTLFDPQVVDICIHLFKNKGFKFSK
jgi:PAS domain S-box-containing protein/putative nucleotidyltransferase with HDIG domain